MRILALLFLRILYQPDSDVRINLLQKERGIVERLYCRVEYFMMMQKSHGEETIVSP